MAGFDVEVRYSEEHGGLQGRNAVRSWLNAFRDAAARPEAAMRRIGEQLVVSTKRRFNIEMSPRDGKWARNSLVTIARKGHSKPLKGKTNALRDSIRYELQGSGKAVSVGSPLVYAAVQQFGARKGQFGTMRNGAPIPWGDIPARPFLGRSDADQQMIFDEIRRHLGLI